MSFASNPITARCARALFIVTVGLAAAACGGGGEDAAVAVAEPATAVVPMAAAARTAAAPANVRVEGCVLDRFHVPTTGTPVRALSADGRLLASALSDGAGRFALRLPAQGDVTLQIDRPQGESLPLRVGAAASMEAACLVDDLA